MRHERNALVKMTDRLRRRGFAVHVHSETSRASWRKYASAVELPEQWRIEPVTVNRWQVYLAEPRTRAGGFYGPDLTITAYVSMCVMDTAELEAWLS